ncbi:MAG: AsmA family protein [Verrucomicrobiota bacterium]
MKQILWIALPIAGIGLLLIVFFAVVLGVPHFFLKSNHLRQILTSETNERFGTEGQWMPFELKNWQLHSAGYDGTGDSRSVVETMRIENVQIQLDWMALLRRSWKVTLIEVKHVSIEMRQPPDKAKPATTPRNMPSISPLAALLPRDYQIDRINFSNIDVTWRTKDSEYQVTDVVAELTPSISNNWSASLKSGTFSPPSRSKWKLNSGRAIYQNNEVSLDRLEWFGEQAGLVTINGAIEIEPNLKAKLDFQGKGVPASALLESKWQSFVQGTINTRATATIDLKSVTISGEASGNLIRLIGIPQLASLSIATGIREWTELPLDTAWMEFKYADEVLTIDKSIFESSQLCRLEGSVSIEDDNLSGTYQVGVRDPVVRKIPGAKLSVFSLEQGGFHWAQPPMQLSGTMKAPKEDLSPRLKTAALNVIQDRIEKGMQKGLDYLDGLFNAR